MSPIEVRFFSKIFCVLLNWELSKNSVSNPVTFPVLQGSPWAPERLSPPPTKTLATPLHAGGPGGRDGQLVVWYGDLCEKEVQVYHGAKTGDKLNKKKLQRAPCAATLCYVLVKLSLAHPSTLP